MKTKIYTVEDLKKKLGESTKSYDLEKITQAYATAVEAHEGQCRKSGEPYISHPIAVAIELIDLGMDTDTLCAALLHDVVEDTDVELSVIEKQFGSEVALLVDGVTKLGRIPFSSREQQQAENVRKMLLAVAQDVRVIIIKLADRLHNMRTIQALPEQKRRDKSLETMEVYAPLAHRLGIRAIKEELEDISLKYLDPIGYESIEQALMMRNDDRQQFLNAIKERIIERLSSDFHNPYVEGRVKSIYGIYRKVYMQGRSFEEIFDVYAIRIIVDTVIECYNILGIIHDMFRPIPNRFKDYISTPKPNMYQSLHTTVVGKEAIPFEVQIRTWDMHHTAEFGIAAHWKYKAGVSGSDKLDERLAWVRQLLEVQKESDDVEDIVRSIKNDLAPEEVFVFTPKGDVISLPAGSTVIDFAYAIHSAVGNRMIGAKVDGRQVSLDFQVRTGMIVEIVTSNAQGHGPNRDWLKMVKTSEARNKIRQWFKREKRDENIEEGRAELEREFRRNLISLPDAEMKEFLLEIAKRQHLNSIDDFCAAIGYGGISLSRIMPRIKDDFQKKYRVPEQPKIEPTMKPKRERRPQSGVIVEGLDSCLVKFAKCCNPLPGDDIVGFVTRGYGVSIHKRDCINVQSAMKDETQQDRWVKTTWAGLPDGGTFKSTIEIYAEDRDGMLVDVSVGLTNLKVPLHSLNAREMKDDHIMIQVTIGTKSVEQLNSIIATLKRIEGVVSIERTYQ